MTRKNESEWCSVGIKKDLKEKIRQLGKKDENWNDLLERLICDERGEKKK